MALLLVLLFIVLPIAEIYVIIQVGEAIGVLPTIALLVLDAFLGAALWRHQGRAAWRLPLPVAGGDPLRLRFEPGRLRRPPGDAPDDALRSPWSIEGAIDWGR